MEMLMEKTKVMRISRQPSPVQTTAQNQPENVKYFNYSGSMITDNVRWTRAITSRTVMAKTSLNKQVLTSANWIKHVRNKLVKCYIWSIALHGSESWTLRTVDQKSLESFQMWCWRRMEKICWTDDVRNVEVLQRRVKKESNILQTIKTWKANWIGYILHRNRLLKHVIEGKRAGRVEVTVRRGWRCKQLLDGLKATRKYWKLKEGALDRNFWRTSFGRGYGIVVIETTEWMDCLHLGLTSTKKFITKLIEISGRYNINTAFSFLYVAWLLIQSM